MDPRPAKLVVTAERADDEGETRSYEQPQYEVVGVPGGVYWIVDHSGTTDEVMVTFEAGASPAGVQTVADALAKAYTTGFDYGWEYGFCECYESHGVTAEEVEGQDSGG